jgi:hypothetical protein
MGTETALVILSGTGPESVVGQESAPACDRIALTSARHVKGPGDVMMRMHHRRAGVHRLRCWPSTIARARVRRPHSGTATLRRLPTFDAPVAVVIFLAPRRGQAG